MIQKISSLLAASTVLAVALPAQAALFSDNFDSNDLNSGGPLLNGWTITNAGDVDLIGNCPPGAFAFDLIPGNGCYIDLDGNGTPGQLANQVNLLGSTQYLLKFDLAGSQRGDTNIVDVMFGTATMQITRESLDPFQQYSLLFTPPTSGSYDFSFLNDGGDYFGALLDNVSVDQQYSQPPSQPTSSVPAPLPLLGAGAAFAQTRRLRSRVLGARRSS